MAGENGVDGCANGRLDVEDDTFMAISEKNSAASLGGQEGDGLDLDEIDFHKGKSKGYKGQEENDC